MKEKLSRVKGALRTIIAVEEDGYCKKNVIEALDIINHLEKELCQLRNIIASQQSLLNGSAIVPNKEYEELKKKAEEATDFRKQVDELTVRTSELFHELQEEKRTYAGAIKDTANKIYKIVDNEYYKDEDWFMCRVRGCIETECDIELE